MGSRQQPRLIAPSLRKYSRSPDPGITISFFFSFFKKENLKPNLTRRKMVCFLNPDWELVLQDRGPDS